MKAEEYYRTENGLLKMPHLTKLENEKIAFAEAYHKAKVEAITDKIIVQKSYEKRGVIPSEIYRDGARWLKQKLLKQ